LHGEKSMKPLVSILIPAYNAEPFIADTIQSALAQTWPEKEIIIVDDGSTDDTLSVARGFASEGITVITQKNQGASAARNKAFSLCRGDYIQWLDADDLLACDKISKQMETVERISNKRILFSSEWGEFMFRPRRAKFISTPLWNNLSPLEWLLRKMGQDCFMQPATWLVSRELTEAAGPWDTQLSLDDDGEYFCRVILASEKIEFISAAKTYYRMSGFSSLHNVDKSKRKLDSLWLSMQLHIRYIRSLEDSERTRAACVAYLKKWLGFFYPERMDVIERAQQLASAFGGRLELPPNLSWKYRWIQKTLGWSTARQAQVNYNEWKASALRSWDKTMFYLEKPDAV